jgi:phage gp46-like protein
MTSQIGAFFTSAGLYDLARSTDGGRLTLVEDLDTAVALSLLTDKRAAPGMILPQGADAAGWWGDTYPDEAGDAFGSWLWTLEGRPRDDQTLQDADAFTRDALKWMLADGVADKIDVAKEFTKAGLRVKVGITHGTSIRWTQWWARTL